MVVPAVCIAFGGLARRRLLLPPASPPARIAAQALNRPALMHTLQSSAPQAEPLLSTGRRPPKSVAHEPGAKKSVTKHDHARVISGRWATDP